jgi:hypothetical protein
MTKEVKDGLRETVPEVVMSRKHRKAMEYRARTTAAATQQNAKNDEPQQQQKWHQTSLKKPLLEEKRAPTVVNVATQPRRRHLQEPHQWNVSARPDAIGGVNSWRRTAAPLSISVA